MNIKESLISYQSSLLDNNIDSFKHEFQLADFYVDNITVARSALSEGSLDISATIANSGKVSAKNIEIAFFMIPGDAEVKPFLNPKNQYISDAEALFAKLPATVDGQILLGIYMVEELAAQTDIDTPNSEIITATLPCPKCFGDSAGSFRIIAMVNSQFKIAESNSFNNLAKDQFDLDNIDAVTWADISGASSLIEPLPQSPDLKLTEVKFKADKSRLLPGETATIQYQIQNAGSYFTASSETSVSIYLSEDATLDQQQDEKLKSIPVNQDIQEESTTEVFDIDFPINLTKSPDIYYVFVVLNSDGKESASPPLRIDILKVFIHSTEPKIEEIKENFSDAPVYLGDMVTGGQNSQLTVKFPAYSEAVDHYIAIIFPNGHMFFVQQNSVQPFTANWEPYAQNTTESSVNTLFEPQSIVSSSLTYPAMLGNWSIFWLTAPSGTGSLKDIIEKGTYELGYYPFNVTETSFIK